jgi:fumarylacetoacetase
MINDTHDPGLRSWVSSANSSTTDFPIQNLPLTVFRRLGSQDAPGIGVAIGDQIVDIRAAAALGLFDDLPDPLREAAHASTLNPLMALGNTQMSRFRRQLIKILDASGGRAEPRALVAMDRAELLSPATIGDYTDFYASIYHATNVGKLFRPDNPLLPNYKYVPIAYHGRASSVVISGTPVVRPWGQVKGTSDHPTFRPTERLDYEMEIGGFVGLPNMLGNPIPIEVAEQHLFGFCLVNDWSARDIQAWEYQPLGPFLAKSFATTVSPWVVTQEALAPFRCPAFARPPSDPQPLPHLFSHANQTEGGYDITVETFLRSADMRRRGLEPVRLSRSSLRQMYWTMAQMVTHQTSNGCNVRPGDLVASGTISGPDAGSQGCLLELTNGGTRPLELPTGERRAFLADGDEVIMRGFCERSGYARVGFGECSGIIYPARPGGRQ